ncbi:hypothetical protein BKA70DRAFT_1223611 [Coprinopsis sp. MPI-PUGE-AT-0042]|nr:hypothetical protein BKA70DRAFT_1223611 [Coprinopsis sp. MPI-PUGE-AT-0042]
MPSTSPSTHTTNGSTSLDVNFEIEQETGFRDKPHIRQTKKRKGIAYTMRVFPTIPKIQASRPRWHKGRMWAGGGHGRGDEEDEEDTRRQRAHLNTPNSRSGLVTREGGDGFTADSRLSPWHTKRLLSVGLKRSQRVNSRHRRHSLLHDDPPEARTTTMIATNRPQDLAGRDNRQAPRILQLRQNSRSHPREAATWVLQYPKKAKWRIIGVPQLQVTTGRDDLPDGFWHGLPVFEGHWTCDEAEQVALHSQAVSSPILTLEHIIVGGSVRRRLCAHLGLIQDTNPSLLRMAPLAIDHDVHWAI